MQALKYIPRYCVADYQAWDGDWELWDGIPVSMSPSPFGLHQWVATQLATSLNLQLDQQGCTDCAVVLEVDWIVDDHTVVRPDVSVCCDKFPEKFIQQPPALVIEVLSPSTAEKDRTSKLALYDTQGVGGYLIVDLEAGRFEIHERVRGHLKRQADSNHARFTLHDSCVVELELPRRPV